MKLTWSSTAPVLEAPVDILAKNLLLVLLFRVKLDCWVLPGKPWWHHTSRTGTGVMFGFFLVIFTIEYVVTIDFHCSDIGWNCFPLWNYRTVAFHQSFRWHSGESEMSEISILGEIRLPLLSRLYTSSDAVLHENRQKHKHSFGVICTHRKFDACVFLFGLLLALTHFLPQLH